MNQEPDDLQEMLLDPDPVVRLTGELRRLRRSIDRERQAKKWALRIVGVVLLVALAIAGYALDTARTAQDAASTAQDAITQVIAQRTESRKNTCEGNRIFAHAHNALVRALAADQDGDRTPDEQAEVDAAAKPHIVPVPDCTPQGIEDFYEGRTP